MKVKMANQTQQTVMARLKVSRIGQVLNKNYSSSTEYLDHKKSDAKVYSKRITGSVRLQREKFYSPKEYRSRIARVKKAQLP